VTLSFAHHAVKNLAGVPFSISLGGTLKRYCFCMAVLPSLCDEAGRKDVGPEDIELFDKYNCQTYASTAPSWMTNVIKEYNGNPYAHLVEMAKTISNPYVISSKGCPSRPDHLHFNPAGYRELERRYAVLMLSLLSYRTTEPAAVKNLLPATGMVSYTALWLSVAVTGREPTGRFTA